MAYKKYIQKNGKRYGPYLYHSKRVEGKVVSEYYGTKEKNSGNKTLLFILAGIVLLATLIFFFVSLNKNITGNVVMGLDASYVDGEPLDGVLRFALREGELLPENTQVIFENSGGIYSFALKDVLDEEIFNGNYYVYNNDISGIGLGYGVEGEKVIYPEIEFTLQIYSESEGGEEVVPSWENETGIETEIVNNESDEEVVVEEETTSEELVSEKEFVEEIETVPEQEKTETVLEETSIEEVPVEEVPQSEPSSEETTAETIPVEESSSAPITGNIVKNSGGIFASFFRFTGMVSLELENEVNGVTSKDKPFVYELGEGETAELKLKSVRLNGEDIEDGMVFLTVEDRKAIVLTDYSETEKGYGKDYIGSGEKTISLDLSDLNLILEEGDLTVKLVYDGEELVHLNTILKSGEESSNETTVEIEEIKEINETTEVPLDELNKTIVEENETVEEIFNSSLWSIGDFLTSEEKKVLVEEFGEVSLETTISEIYKGRIIKGYTLGKYYVEYSYDSSLLDDILEIQMERDRIKFLKDIANSLSREEIISEKLEDNSSYIF